MPAGGVSSNGAARRRADGRRSSMSLDLGEQGLQTAAIPRPSARGALPGGRRPLRSSGRAAAPHRSARATSSSHAHAAPPRLRRIPRPGGPGPLRPRLPPVDRRRPDARLGLPQDRPGRALVPVRERHRRREGRPVQLPGDRALPPLRGHAAARSASRPAGEPDRRRSRSDDPFEELRRARRVVSVGPTAGPAPVRRAARSASPAYDSVRYTENLPDAPPDDRGLPDLAFNFYDRMVIFDHIRKTVLVVALAALRAADRPREAYRPGRRGDRRTGRPPGRARPGARRRWTSTPTAPVDPAAGVELHARGLRGRRPPLPGIHQGRRHLPGRPQPAVPRRDDGRPVRHLPRPARGEPQPVPVLPAVRRLQPHRQLARDPGARRGRRRSRSAPSPAPAGGAGTRPRTSPWPRSCWPTPRSGPSTSCSWTSAATTSAGSPTSPRCSSAT